MNPVKIEKPIRSHEAKMEVTTHELFDTEDKGGNPFAQIKAPIETIKLIICALNEQKLLVRALLDAREALKCSEPKMKHYTVPVQRHADAIRAIDAALAKVSA